MLEQWHRYKISYSKYEKEQRLKIKTVILLGDAPDGKSAAGIPARLFRVHLANPVSARFELPNPMFFFLFIVYPRLSTFCIVDMYIQT